MAPDGLLRFEASPPEVAGPKGKCRAEEVCRGIAAGVDCFEHTGSATDAYPDSAVADIAALVARYGELPYYQFTPQRRPSPNANSTKCGRRA